MHVVYILSYARCIENKYETHFDAITKGFDSMS